MAPPYEFYRNPTPEDIAAAQRWEKSKYVPSRGYGDPFFLCKIITSQHQALFATISLSPYYIEEGAIDIPFATYIEEQMGPLDKWKMGEAKKLQNVTLLGGKKLNDFDTWNILGLTKEKSGRFYIISLGSALREIQFQRESDDPLGHHDYNKSWPSSALRVEGLVRDFLEDFPGWRVEPIAVQPNNN